MRIVSNDSGKYHNCAVSEEKELMFKNRVREIPAYDPDLDKVVEYTSKFYSLGEDDGEIDTEPTKLKFNHKLTTLYAITQVLPDLQHGEEIALVIGTPVTLFENAAHKEEFKNYLLGTHEIEVNNKDRYNFTIKHVLVMPESAGVVHSNPDKFKDKLIGVIDWGGLQANCMIFDNRKMVKSSGFTRQIGGYALETQIINTLNSDGYNFQEYEIPYVIKSREFKIKNTVDKIVKSYINRILTECRKNNWNIGALDLLFTGGTSLRFKEYLNDLNYMVSLNALMDNARGNLEVGKAWLRKILSK